MIIVVHVVRYIVRFNITLKNTNDNTIISISFYRLQNSYIRTRLSFKLNDSNNENSLVNVSKRTVLIKDTLGVRL